MAVPCLWLLASPMGCSQEGLAWQWAAPSKGSCACGLFSLPLEVAGNRCAQAQLPPGPLTGELAEQKGLAAFEH